MQVPSRNNLRSATLLLRKGGVGILATDTIYGVVGSALKPKTVARIYRLRKRSLKKPMIILIGSVRDLKKFGIVPSLAAQKILKRFWPGLAPRSQGDFSGPVSIILDLPQRANIVRQFRYLHRGTGTLAFRLPKPVWLRKLLARTGPLVAPSANWEGHPPAKTIAGAQRYFGTRVDFYIDSGPRRGKPSKLVQIKAEKAVVLRA